MDPKFMPLKMSSQWPVLHIDLEAQVEFLQCLEQTCPPRAPLAGSNSSSLPTSWPSQAKGKLSTPVLFIVLYVIQFLLANIPIAVRSLL